jgi:hypothetical protein
MRHLQSSRLADTLSRQARRKYYHVELVLLSEHSPTTFGNFRVDMIERRYGYAKYRVARRSYLFRLLYETTRGGVSDKKTSAGCVI